MMFNIVHTESEQFSWCWQKNRIREAEQEDNELRNRRKKSDQGNLLRGIDNKTKEDREFQFIYIHSQ